MVDSWGSQSGVAGRVLGCVQKGLGDVASCSHDRKRIEVPTKVSQVRKFGDAVMCRALAPFRRFPVRKRDGRRRRRRRSSRGHSDSGDFAIRWESEGGREVRVFGVQGHVHGLIFLRCRWWTRGVTEGTVDLRGWRAMSLSRAR